MRSDDAVKPFTSKRRQRRSPAKLVVSGGFPNLGGTWIEHVTASVSGAGSSQNPESKGGKCAACPTSPRIFPMCGGRLGLNLVFYGTVAPIERLANRQKSRLRFIVERHDIEMLGAIEHAVEDVTDRHNDVLVQLTVRSDAKSHKRRSFASIVENREICVPNLGELPKRRDNGLFEIALRDSILLSEEVNRLSRRHDELLDLFPGLPRDPAG